MVNIVLRILLLIVALLVGVGLGLLFRRLLVRRLKKTVLDSWIIQTLGVLITLPTIIIALLFFPLIITWNVQSVVLLWAKITGGLQGKDITSTTLGLLGNLFTTLLIISLGIGIGRTLMKIIIGRVPEERLDINIRTLLARILYGFIITLIVFWVLTLWQISFTVPVVVISAMGAAFAFSIQDILKNLVAGLCLLVERPFHIGDQITTADYTGRVVNVQLRATLLHLVSGEEISIPNMLIFGGIVVNNSLYEQRRAVISLSMPQEEFDKEATPDQILKIVKELENVLVKPEPNVFISRFTGTFGGTSGSQTGYTGQIVSLTLRFWMAAGRFQTVDEVMCALHKTLPNVDLVVESSGGNV